MAPLTANHASVLDDILRKYNKTRAVSGTAPKAANNNRYGPIDPWARAKHPPLPEGLLPPILERFARVQAETMGVDPGGLAAAALTVCAAAVSDTIQLRVKAHDRNWVESARLWVALVGQPSAKKSPVISAASAPLKSIDADLYRAFTEAKAEHDALPADERKTTAPPPNTRIRLEDTTIEAAQEVLKDSPNGVLCLQDELTGWFGSMEKYTSGRGSAKDRGFWLQAFNGGSYVVNRIGRGSVWIDNLSVCLLGGIQPDPIRRIAADMHDDGLLQRLFPIVMGESSVGKDEPTPPVVAEYSALVHRLHKLANPKTGLVEVPLRFNDAAQAIRADLAERHHALVGAWEGVNKKLAAHIGKYDGLFARLCVVWHCCESTAPRPASIVTADTAGRVAAFLHGFLLPHAVAFYTNVIGMSDRHDALLATAGYILSHELDEITARDVRRGDRTMRALDTKQAETVLETLDAMGWLLPLFSIRRDSKNYQVHPSVHSVFRDRAAAENERRDAARELIASTL
ncbi:DUF3987 domain-containing protein [Aurantimonas sp. C2-5-R2]|uniref:DUF3987 domain-containing protein n=1 Tax=Aurantimonas sp. C2-5-R2 TaxID=3113713 RepID=UPI002F92C65B